MKKNHNRPDQIETCPCLIARRDFLKKSLKIGVGGVAGLTLIPFLPGCCPMDRDDDFFSCADAYVRKGYSAAVSSVWIPKGDHKTSYPVFNEMIAGATDFDWLSRNDRVLLKLSLNSAYGFPATTDPWLVGCMIDLLKEKGTGRILVGDQSGIFQQNSTRACLKQTGIMKIIQEKGAEAVCFEEAEAGGYQPVPIDNWDGTADISRVIHQVDHIIYLPRIASHFLSGVTFGIKIAVGFLNAESRLVMHRGRLNDLYGSINDIPDIRNRFRLCVTSARKLMTRGGPDRGSVVEPDYGLVFASDNLLASDVMSGAFFELHRCTGRDIYCHESIQYYIKRNGNLEHLIWNSLNPHPDPAVTRTLIKLLKKVKV